MIKVKKSDNRIDRITCMDDDNIGRDSWSSEIHKDIKEMARIILEL